MRTDQLTPREKQVLEQMCLGKTNRQIADVLAVSVRTAEAHVYHIYDKFEFYTLRNGSPSTEEEAQSYWFDFVNLGLKSSGSRA